MNIPGGEKKISCINYSCNENEAGLQLQIFVVVYTGISENYMNLYRINYCFFKNKTKKQESGYMVMLTRTKDSLLTPPTGVSDKTEFMS